MMVLLINYGDFFHLACNDALLVDDASGLLRNPYCLKALDRAERDSERRDLKAKECYSDEKKKAERAC